MSRRLSLRRPVAALLFVVQLAGCTSWHVETLPPAELIAQRHPDRLRVEGVDGKRVIFYGSEVQGDSLRGRANADSTGSRAVSLDGVRSVSTSHSNVGGTIGLIVGIPAVTLGTLLIVVGASCGGGQCN